MSGDAGGGQWMTRLLAVVGAVVSAFGLWISFDSRTMSEDALELSHSEARSAARDEIVGYVIDMARYDREGGAANRAEIEILAQQIEAVAKEFRAERLRLAPATLRLAAQYTALATTNLELATRFANRALDTATGADGPGGIVAPLEAVQAERVLGDIASQNRDARALRVHFDRALHMSERYGGSNRYIREEAVSFTEAYYAIAALQMAQGRPRLCSAAAQVWHQFGRQARLMAANYDVYRRGQRVRVDTCGLGVEDVLASWAASWKSHLTQ